MIMDGSVSKRSNAIVTASYDRDFERFAILCETIDTRVRGYEHHYVLVEPRDVALFRTLEGTKRTVVDERDILPNWLRVFPDPFRPASRRIWLSPRTAPLRGWHVQQLRRMAIADHVPQDGLLYCDSDTAFVRAFDLDTLWNGDLLRLYRREDGLAEAKDDHVHWVRDAARALGVPEARMNGHDYVSTHVTWRADTARALCRHIEDVHGRHWVAALGRSRKFSECMLYGHFVDDLNGGEGHFIDNTPLCNVHWFAPPPTTEELASWIASLQPGQVSVGIQSYIPMPVSDFRRAVGL
jgi:hypothetical protein